MNRRVRLNKNGWSGSWKRRRFNRLVGILWNNASFKRQGLVFLLTFFITFVGKGTILWSEGSHNSSKIPRLHHFLSLLIETHLHDLLIQLLMQLWKWEVDNINFLCYIITTMRTCYPILSLPCFLFIPFH